MLSSESVDNWESSAFFVSFPLLYPLSLSFSLYLFSSLKHRGVLSRVVATLSTTLAKATPLPRWAFRELFPPLCEVVCSIQLHTQRHFFTLTHKRKIHVCLVRHIVHNFNTTQEKEHSPPTTILLSEKSILYNVFIFHLPYYIRLIILVFFFFI